MELNEKVRVILDRQLNGLAPDQSDKKRLHNYSTPRDKVIIFVIYGQTVGIFGSYSGSSTSSTDARRQLVTFTLYWVYLAIAIFVLIYIATVGFYYVGERTARALRNAYLKAIIRQNMAFFDTHEPGEVSARIMSDMTHVQEGITTKLSIALTAMATFAAAFVVSMVVHWRTALVLSPTYVLMTLFGLLGGTRILKYHKEAKVASEKASSLAQESISSVRQVYALGVQHHLATKYESFLNSAGQPSRKALYVIGFVIAWSNAVPPLVHALTFWAGSIFLVQGDVSVAQLTTIALVVVIGAFAIVRIAPAAQALASTMSSASVILSEMCRRSPQDPFDPSGAVVDSFQGNIELRGVMKEVSFSCPAMKTTAIVGSSGSGKSSIINLLERFYEPTGGQIYLDGVDIQSLNLRWLRGQTGLVRQQPILFDTTIYENIRYGTVSFSTQPSGEELTKQIISAAEMANAHDFIMALPDGYQTRVGENATQLSGGQKQRIAIARALMRDPKILLLDEATSALDAASESVVQAALNKAAKHRTTVVIAHRLSTIRHADNIVVMSQGAVAEQGTHADLIARDGHYARLVRAQQIISRRQDENNDESGKENLGEPLVDPIQEDERATALKAEPWQEQRPGDESGGIFADANKPKNWGLGRTLGLIVRMNKSERWILLFGLICSIVAGLVLPGQSIVFAKSLEALSSTASEYGTMRSQVNLLAGIFLALACANFILYIGLGFSLAYTTEKLARTIRDRCFRSIVAQDIEFFDLKANSTGSLLSILTTSTDALTGLSGPIIGGALTFICTILGGIILSVALGWKLALVCTATIPLVVACGWVRLQMLAIFDSQTRQNGVDAASYATEIVKAASTVASLGLEEFVLERYDGFLAKQSEKSLGSILRASSLYAASQSVVYFAYALAFWYGGTLLLNGEYSLFQVYICYTALISGAQIAGSVFSFAPDASKAMIAGQEVDSILQRRLTRPSEQRSYGEKERSQGYSHHVQFNNVTFAYPSRRARLALDNFSLDVGTGQFVALVGPSGCGKSTTLALIERFYSPGAGSILIDGQDLSTVDLDKHRRSVSLVSQEAVLFSTTIRENIAMGLPGEDVSDEAIWAACRQANIEEFITSLQDGLSTMVGPGGSMLSGGQKQRIEIARALLRNPKILLLDEATSALDTESEVLVQEALELASRHRTTIAVAHRLSTIKKADLICVLDHGKLVESGTHDELVRARGRYWELLEMQDLQ
ncbi:multidrug resistance protein 1, 2, 3 [Truncatella angustata]|uniref:Multidrug resistance protein 1, 2, 3 n=1 Tax=Truncatella angustata TaxID=152316 RepID=A0A9P8ZXA1_9PEZI|nr:multidrug resistance protein 1, 2, 3 [Truncatella angustata]KAH6652878.1 multidrug resistance protein 1, 2, 3 [Truncatella angustata]